MLNHLARKSSRQWPPCFIAGNFSRSLFNFSLPGNLIQERAIRDLIFSNLQDSFEALSRN